MTWRLPRRDEHLAVVGRNGTGKTQFGVHTLAERNDLARHPTVILDYKGDELINAITRAREIAFNEIPKHPGLYILHSSPSEDEETEAFLHRLWAHENCGLFVDEGYMLPKGTAFRNILTQGRSKRIPVTTLSQRPIEIDRFVFSEASHVAFFHLNDRRDIKTVREFTPEGFIEWVPSEFPQGRLPDYHCRWYSIKSDKRFVLTPAPSADEIIAAIDKQLEPKRRFL